MLLYTYRKGHCHQRQPWQSLRTQGWVGQASRREASKLQKPMKPQPRYRTDSQTRARQRYPRRIKSTPAAPTCTAGERIRLMKNLNNDIANKQNVHMKSRQGKKGEFTYSCEVLGGSGSRGADLAADSSTALPVLPSAWRTSFK